MIALQHLPYAASNYVLNSVFFFIMLGILLTCVARPPTRSEVFNIIVRGRCRKTNNDTLLSFVNIS